MVNAISLLAMRHLVRIELSLKLALPAFGRLLPNLDTWQVPASHFRGGVGAEQLVRKRGPDRVKTRNLSIAFSNSRCRTLPLSARGIRADARACKLARDGELREKACS